MGKNFKEIVKILMTVLLSSLMTIVILAGTVIGNKANVDYVDKKDQELREEIKTSMSEHEKIHRETKAQFDQIQNDLSIIKDHLINN